MSEPQPRIGASHKVGLRHRPVPLVPTVSVLTLTVSLGPYIYARSDSQTGAYVASVGVATLLGVAVLSNGHYRAHAMHVAARGWYMVLYVALIPVSHVVNMLVDSSIPLATLAWAIGYAVMAAVALIVLPVVYWNTRARLPQTLVILGLMSALIGVFVALTDSPTVLGLPVQQLQPLTPLGISLTSGIYYEANRYAMVCFGGLAGCALLLRPALPPWMRWLTLVCVGVLCLGILVSWSRATYAAVLVAATLWVALSTRGVQRILLAGFLGIAALLVAVVAPSIVDLSGELLVSQGLGRRSLTWPAAAGLIAEAPLLGHGFGNPSALQDNLFDLTGHATAIHNTPLSLGYQGGLPLMAAYTGMYIAAFRRLLVSDAPPHVRNTLFAVLSGTLVTSLTLEYTPGGAGIGALIVTLALGLANTSVCRRHPTALPVRTRDASSIELASPVR